MNTFKPIVSTRLARTPIILTSLVLLSVSSALACQGGSASLDASVGPDGTTFDVAPSRQDVPAMDLRPRFDVGTDGPPSFVGGWSYQNGTNQLACGEQGTSIAASSGRLLISPALGGGLDVEDGGCHIHFVTEGNVARANPPMQECGGNTTPANWTLTLKPDGKLEEVVGGSIQVENVSCFIDGLSTLSRQ